MRSIATYTRIPLNIDWNDSRKHTPSVCFLPYVGVIVGLLSAWPLLFNAWTAEFQAVLMMLSAVLITGAFHEDGLLDASDGLVGGWSAEQRLIIMKDSRVGSYGVIAGIFSFALKWWLLSLWIVTESVNSLYGVLLGWLVVHMVARWLPILLMQSLTYVSQGQSKAKAMISPFTPRGWAWLAATVTIAIGLAGLDALLRIIAMLAVLYILCVVYFKRRLNGYNGDTLGAAEQVAEIAVLFSLLGWVA
ncbi:adenosylcobinamide-GDP ribazoletransferase [Marinomonas piezotolerans]|nr:adenosylcobinamide-GDP ribazoletransferase [Marinomonas piezotolerans]